MPGDVPRNVRFFLSGDAFCLGTYRSTFGNRRSTLVHVCPLLPNFGYPNTRCCLFLLILAPIVANLNENEPFKFAPNGHVSSHFRTIRQRMFRSKVIPSDGSLAPKDSRQVWQDTVIATPHPWSEIQLCRCPGLFRYRVLGGYHDPATYGLRHALRQSFAICSCVVCVVQGHFEMITQLL